jgi:hypothetical protein
VWVKLKRLWLAGFSLALGSGDAKAILNTSTHQHFNGSTQHINSLQDRSPCHAHLVSNFGPNTAELDAKLGDLCWAFDLALLVGLPQAIQSQR